MNLNKFTIQKSFAINAGAGSGKTYTLSRRYVNAILGFDFFRENDYQDLYYENLKPASVRQIVTITYTEAAALEMKERIFGLISKIIDYKKLSDEDIAHSQAEYEKAVEEIKKLKNVKEASVSSSGISVHYDDGKEKFPAMYLLPTPVDAPPAPLAAGLVSY